MKPKVVRHLVGRCRLIKQPRVHQNRNLAMTVMKSGFVGLLLLHLSSTVSGLGSVVSRGYSYINIYYTWQEAQTFCRNLNEDSDLAIFYWQPDIEQQDMSKYNAWIGLHRETDENETLDGWTWPNGEQLRFDAWAYGEPKWGQRCGFVNYNSKRLISGDCKNYFFFICDNLEFIPESKMWNEAKDYCQDKNHSLANFTDIDDITSGVNEEDFPVWIGLYRDGETWRWSAGTSGYINWALGEPKNNSDCVSILSACKQMAAQNCSHRFPFLCYRNNLVIIKENKTWEEALDHCRALRSGTQQQFQYDLVSVQPEDYNNIRAVVTEANTEEVWIGLRFLAGKWLWVNGADMKLSNLALCPPTVQHCGVLRKTSTGSIETRDCAERRNFVCYRM